MKNTKTIASLVIAILTAGSAFAQDADIPFVSFSWSQADPDPATGSGELTATINGVEFSSSMPTPVINQKSTTDQPIPADLGIVGFANTVDSVQPGTPNGFHLGWSASAVQSTSTTPGVCSNIFRKSVPEQPPAMCGATELRRSAVPRIGSPPGRFRKCNTFPPKLKKHRFLQPPGRLLYTKTIPILSIR